MNLKISIEGIGVVGGFGCGVADLNQALKSGRSSPDRTFIQTKGGSVPTPVFRADTSALADYVPKRVLRRIDHYSRMAILGAYLALDDAGKLDADKENMGIVIASGYGASSTMFEFMDSVIDDGDPLASPTKFSNSVHNAAAAHVSILLKSKGPTLTVSQFEMSVPSALISACRWLEQKRVHRVLFGGVDEYCDALGYCRDKIFGHTREKAIQPLNFQEHSAIAGEGAAFFLLSGPAKKNDSYGHILDVQFGNLMKGKPEIPDDAVVFMGADGHVQCGLEYEKILSKESTIAAYSPLYGSMPMGTGLDMAVAALSIQSNRIFPQPESIQNHHDSKTRGKDLEGKSICCLKIGPHGEYGLITMGR